MNIRSVFLVMAVGMTNLSHAGSDVSEEQVREWVARGEIMAFEEIYAQNKTRLNGRLLDLEVEIEDDRIVYEVEILNAEGDVREFYIDAVTGVIVKEEDEH